MIPYIEPPSVEIAGLTIHAFQVFIVLAVMVGFEVALRRGAARGLPRKTTSRLVAWTIVSGFVISHPVALATTSPERLSDPRALLQIWNGMSSVGGLVGGMLGLLAVAWLRGLSGRDTLSHLDNVAFAWPFAHVLGRMGCALAHDHLGVASTHWLAVQFPTGPRFDVGLLELLYILPLAGVFVALDRRPWPRGFFFGLFFLLYGPARFVLDTLRIEEPHYLGWTLGQHFGVLAAMGGLAIVMLALRRRFAEVS